MNKLMTMLSGVMTMFGSSDGNTVERGVDRTARNTSKSKRTMRHQRGANPDDVGSRRFVRNAEKHMRELRKKRERITAKKQKGTKDGW